MQESYDDGDNTAVSEPGRFDVDKATGTAAIAIGIGWYEARANSPILIEIP